MRAAAAVFEKLCTPLSVTEVEIDEPGAGEALVKIVATGVCHTDALARDGDMPFPAPGVLGHEGAGIVEADGAGVTNVAVGDKVVIGWPWCGQGRNCLEGQPRYCLQLGPLVIAGSRADGTTAPRRLDGSPLHSHFFGQSSFASSIVIYGAGAAGLDPVVTVSEICGGPADFALDCAGNLNALRQAGDSIGMRGTLALIGGAPAGASFAMDHQATLWGKKVVGILGGEGRSESLINTLITLNKQGRFPYDRLLQTFPLDQVNEALEASHRGDVIKPVLRRPEGVPGRAPVLLLPPQRRTPRNIASHAIAWSRISWVCLLVIYAMLAPICDDSLT